MIGLNDNEFLYLSLHFLKYNSDLLRGSYNLKVYHFFIRIITYSNTIIFHNDPVFPRICFFLCLLLHHYPKKKKHVITHQYSFYCSDIICCKPDIFFYRPILVPCTFLISHSTAKLISSGIKVYPCFKSF